MSWTTPMTYTSGNVLTAAQQNTYIRDNTNWLFSFLFTPPMAKSYRSSDIGIADSSWEAHQLDINVYDTDSISNTGSPNFTLNTAGAYAIVATGLFDNNATGRRNIRLNVNSSTLIAQNEVGSPSTSLNCGVNVTAHQEFSASDVVIAQVFQTSGGVLTLLGSNVPYGCSLAVCWMGAP